MLSFTHGNLAQTEFQEIFQINPITILLFPNSENLVAVLFVLSGDHPQAVSHILLMSSHLDYEQLLASNHMFFCAAPPTPPPTNTQ